MLVGTASTVGGARGRAAFNIAAADCDWATTAARHFRSRGPPFEEAAADARSRDEGNPA